jgi:hypothetical protein
VQRTVSSTGVLRAIRGRSESQGGWSLPRTDASTPTVAEAVRSSRLLRWGSERMRSPVQARVSALGAADGDARSRPRAEQVEHGSGGQIENVTSTTDEDEAVGKAGFEPAAPPRRYASVPFVFARRQHGSAIAPAVT